MMRRTVKLDLEEIGKLTIVGKLDKRFRVEIPIGLARRLGIKGGESVRLWLDKKKRFLVYEIPK